MFLKYRTAIAAAILGLLAGCEKGIDTDAVDRAMTGVNAIDGAGLGDVMLSAADPDAAVSYFQRAATADPDRLDLMRGLATSLTRAKRSTEARTAWARVVEHEDSEPKDRVALADALIRADDWAAAEIVLDATPPTHETYERYRLEAMIADGNREWDKADHFYEVALGLTTEPASVLNNWGFSKLSRGDHDAAERLLGEAIERDGSLFTAKNNLVLARGARGEYTLPVVPMSQTERAELLHTMGLSAIKRGDVQIGRGLLRDAIETHPRHFDAAASALDALEADVRAAN